MSDLERMSDENTREKYYLVLEWIDEPKTYSCVGSDMILDASKRELRQELIGEVIDIKWKDESGAARVIDISGKRRKMERKCKQLSNEAAEESLFLHGENEDLGKGKRIKVTKNIYEPEENIPKMKTAGYDILKVKENLLNNIQVTQKPQCEQCDDLKIKLKDMTNKYAEENKEKEKYKRKYRDLTKEHSKLQETISNGRNIDMVDLGHGVLVNKIMLEQRVAFHNTPSILARKIMEIVFTVTELKTSSLTGKQSNANKGRVAVLPPLDPLKVSAIIDYTAKQFPGQNAEDLKKKVKVSLTSYLRELRSGKISSKDHVVLNNYEIP